MAGDVSGPVGDGAVTADPKDCWPCAEAEALARVMAVSDLLAMVLWAEEDALRGVERSIRGLQTARGLLLTAGYEAEQ